MEANASVSVIIPAYAMADALERCLNSLKNAANLKEVIVCDGLSDQQTRSVINACSLDIKHLEGKDRGVYDAMNKGLDHVTGDWVYFMGADDQIANPHVFSAMLAQCAAHSIVIAGKVQNLPPRARRVPHWHLPCWDRRILLRNTIHHQGALYRADVLASYRYPGDLKVLGDYHLNLTLWQQGIQACLTDVHVADCSAGGLSKRFQASLYKEEWRLKSAILPVGRKWYQPFWLAMKYLRKHL